MLDRADIVILGIIGLILLISLIAINFTLKRDGWKTQRYKLFHVRDELIYLVASGKIAENDPVFQGFYKAVNLFIERCDRFNLASLISTLENARSKGLDPAEETTRRSLHLELKKKTPEVRAVANRFYATVLEILIENSFPLHLIMRWGSLETVIKIIVGSLEPRGPGRAALKYYDDYSRATRAATA